MPTCKQKIYATQDQVFNYLSELQNVIDLYNDKLDINTIKDLGSACYGKKYQYEVEKTKSTHYDKQAFQVEITRYEPYEFISWSVKFDRRTSVSANTIYIPTTVLLDCTLKPKNDYTLALLDVGFEMKAKWWVKLLFRTVTRIFQNKICQILMDVRKDIEQKVIT